MERLNLHRPSWLKVLAERFKVLDIQPADICPDSQVLGKLYKIFPDLAGDKEIGWSNYGYCQPWRRNLGWWRQLVNRTQTRKG